MENDPRAAAEAARQACIAAALAAYEDAGMLGLCAEGRWEAAISAMQSLELRNVADARTLPPTAPSAAA